MCAKGFSSPASITQGFQPWKPFKGRGEQDSTTQTYVEQEQKVQTVKFKVTHRPQHVWARLQTQPALLGIP